MPDHPPRQAPPRGPLRVVIPALLVASFFIGAATVHRPQDELFPFSSWNLFSFIPHEVTRFEARLLELPDGPVSPPVDPAAHPQTRRAFQVRHVIILERLGEALARGDDEEVAKERSLFEGGLLPPGTKYQVVEVRFDPIERYRTGGYVAVTPRATFVTPRKGAP